MDGIKSFLEVKEVDVDRGIPFCALFDDGTEGKDLVNTPSACSEAFLLFLVVLCTGLCLALTAM